MTDAKNKLIESINELTTSAFASRYFSDTTRQQTNSDLEELTGETMRVELLFANDLQTALIETRDACFNLIKESSASDYQKSEMKWSSTKKRQEMLLPDMRYLVVFGPQSSSANEPRSDLIVGFVSFMFTYEDGYEVVYIYEVHLTSKYRGQGIGKLLLALVETAGQAAGVEKCMLTVFKTNSLAVKWYDRQGYQVDDFSPGPRVLRSGRIKQPTYLILSKPVSPCTDRG